MRLDASDALEMTKSMAAKDQLVALRCGDRREPPRSERSVELLAFSHSSSGLSRFATCAASVAWRQSAPPSERTVCYEE